MDVDFDPDEIERELDRELEDRDRWADDEGMRTESWS